MAPKKGTKAWRDEYVQAYWGINPNTNAVDMVWLTRSGVLHRGTYSHPIHPSNKDRPEAEIRVVFGLTDLFSVPTFLMNDESTKRRIAELHAKADAMAKKV